MAVCSACFYLYYSLPACVQDKRALFQIYRRFTCLINTLDISFTSEKSDEAETDDQQDKNADQPLLHIISPFLCVY